MEFAQSLPRGRICGFTVSIFKVCCNQAASIAELDGNKQGKFYAIVDLSHLLELQYFSISCRAATLKYDSKVIFMFIAARDEDEAIKV